MGSLWSCVTGTPHGRSRPRSNGAVKAVSEDNNALPVSNVVADAFLAGCAP
jgi:hypothetical protein